MATGVLVAGAALQTYGQLEANKAQAAAERQNAKFFQMQKEQAERATRRALDIFEDESAAFVGDQISSFVKAGVDISGSALLQIAGTKAAVGREMAAIAQEGKTMATLAGMRADQADSMADRLSSASLRNITLATGVFNAGASYLRTKQTPGPTTKNTLLGSDTSAPVDTGVIHGPSV